MSKANEFAVEDKVTAIRATMTGLSSSFKEKLRLPLPIHSEQRSSQASEGSLDHYTANLSKEKPMTREEEQSEEDSPSKSRRSQSAFQVNYPKHSYFEEEEDSKQEESVMESQEADFKPSPRFNFSVGSSLDSEYVSNYVAFGGGKKSEDNPAPPDSFRDLHIPNQYEFTLVKTRLEEELQEKDQLITELKTNERKMELKLADSLQLVSRAEEELRLNQQRNKSLQLELEELRSKLINRQEVVSLQQRIVDLDRVNADLKRTKEMELTASRRQVQQLEKQCHVLQSELDSYRHERVEMELDNKTLKEQKSILEENVVNMKKGLQETSIRMRSGDADDLRQQVEKLKRDNQRLSDEMQRRKALGSPEARDELIDQLQTQVRHLKQKARKSCSPGKQTQGNRSQSNGRHTFQSPKESYTRDLIRKDKSHHSRYHHFLKDLVSRLGLSSPEELLSHIESLRHKEKLLSHTEEFIRKLQEIIIDCSPPNAFRDPPSLNHMWKWLRRLVEEYMALRKTPDVLQKLLTLLRIRDTHEIVKAVESVMDDYEKMILGLSKIKAKLRMPLSANVDEVANVLEGRLGNKL